MAPALPIPDVEPVMTTTFPCSDNFVCYPFQLPLVIESFNLGRVYPQVCSIGNITALEFPQNIIHNLSKNSVYLVGDSKTIGLIPQCSLALVLKAVPCHLYTKGRINFTS